MARTSSVTSERMLYEFGNRLRRLRKAQKLRQLDMEDHGLSYKYYQRLEAGQVNPTLLTLYRLATALNISVYEFFGPEPDHETQAICIPCSRKA